MKIFSRRLLAPLALAALALASCDGGGGGGGTEPQTGRVAGSVTAAGAGVQGAAIAMSGGGTATTGASGQFALENVAVGNRTLTLTVPNGFTLAAGQTAARSVAVAAGQTANVTWTLTQTPQNGRITGSVTAGANGVQGATLTLAGGGTTTTSATGAFALENVAPGNRTVTLTVPAGFTLAAGQTAAKNVAVAAGQTANLSWQLTQTQQPNVVEIHLTGGLAFSPQEVTIAPGTTVRWINDVAMIHTITPINPAQPGAWPSQQVQNAGQTYEYTFTTAGTYEYRCNPHASFGMTGRIIVQ